MAEGSSRAIAALDLGIVGLFTAGGLGLGSLGGLGLAATALARTPSRDKDVAWAALVANVFTLLTVLPLAGALLADQAVSRPGAPLDPSPHLSEPSPTSPDRRLRSGVLHGARGELSPGACDNAVSSPHRATPTSSAASRSRSTIPL